MTPELAAKHIFRRFRERWPIEVPRCGYVAPAAQPAVPAYSFDNDAKPEGIYFARVGIISLEREQHTLGPPGRRKWRVPGVIDVRLIGPNNVGRKPLDQLTKAVTQIFQGRTIGATVSDVGITTHASSVAELRRDRDGPGLWILSITTPFEYYERS